MNRVMPRAALSCSFILIPKALYNKFRGYRPVVGRLIANENLVGSIPSTRTNFAGIAQWPEHRLAKANVGGSSPPTCSNSPVYVPVW